MWDGKKYLSLLTHHHLPPPPSPRKSHGKPYVLITYSQGFYIYIFIYLPVFHFQIELLRTTEVDRAKLGNAEKFFVELLGLPKYVLLYQSNGVSKMYMEE